MLQLPSFVKSSPQAEPTDIPVEVSQPWPSPATLFTAENAVSLKQFRLITTHVDIQPFLDEITKNSSLWQKDTSRQDKIRVQRETNAICLRSAVRPFPTGVTNGNNVHASRQTSIAQHFPKIIQWLTTFAQTRRGELGRATIVRLAPKGRVYRHIDQGDYYRIRDRYHLVLQSAAGSVIGSGNEWVRMQPKEVWWFDNKAPHEAYNESNSWRIHLIFDLLPA